MSCYYQGCSRPGTTKEHIPPQSFFPKDQRNQLLTVRSCELTSAFNTRAEAKAGDRFTAAALTLPKFLDAVTRKTKTLRKLQGGTSWNFGRPFYSG
jgi:hypothetical protein